MAEDKFTAAGHPIDAVILWVDGNDPVLAAKRDLYLVKESKTASHPGALPLRFASSGEIRYCLFSILTFAPFIRNIYIVTDGQNPGLGTETEKLFPGRSASVKIVDHKEIFRGYEQYLPSFNSSSILSLIWRIEGLSDNFVYFNDDFFLIRDIRPEDWVLNGRPVLRGEWRLPPFRILLGNRLKTFVNRKLRRNSSYLPKISFYIRQWQTAKLTGNRGRYFFHCHIPYPMNRVLLEDYFSDNRELLEENISYRFRSREQFLLTSLAWHLEIQAGNRQLQKLNHGYFHPYYSDRRLMRRLARCVRDTRIRSICVQSIEVLSQPLREKLLSFMDSVLNLKV